MKNKHIITGVLVILIMMISLVGSVNAGTTRVAVLGFESEDSAWTDSEDREIELLEEIAWQFNDKLAETDDYVVFNRERLLDILEDHRFSRGNRPMHSIINQLRNEINADLFAHGSLDNINVEERDQFRIGPIQFSEVSVTVDLSLDMIDAGSANVKDSYSGRGEVVESGVNFDEGDRVYTLSEDILARALENAVDDLIENIVGERPDTEPVERTVEAEVTAIVGDRLVVNKGERDGLRTGQRGEIIRYRNSSLQVIGEVEVTEVDRDSAFLETTYLNQEPETGDEAIITYEEEVRTERPPREDPIEVLETRYFRIEIFQAEKANGRVTISGTAQARRDEAELELILGNRDFYDHEENRRDMTGRRVTIGDWTNSSGDVARLSETISRGESKYISWSFTGVPEDADRLAGVDLWLNTPHEGEISIEIRDVQL